MRSAHAVCGIMISLCDVGPALLFISDATTVEDPAIMPKSVSCPLNPKGAIFVRVFPTWWPTVRSKHSSSSSSSSIPPQALREPRGGTRKGNKSRPRSLKTEVFHCDAAYRKRYLRFYSLSGKMGVITVVLL